MDIFEAITQDHDQIRELLQKLQRTTPRSKSRFEEFERLQELLTLHQDAEEKVFYQVVLAQKHFRSMALESLEEHNVLMFLLNGLDDLAREDERWRPRITVLHEIFEHHIQVEEDEIFDLVRELLQGEEPQELAQQFQEQKQAEANAQPRLPLSTRPKSNK